jgi:SAM-dependent methyltransferase
VTDERLEDLLARLEREREEGDRLYGTALTTLDRSLPREPPSPDPPPAYDATQLDAVNVAWDILPSGSPAPDSSLKGRLRTFIWRLVGPSLERQKRFNAALVDHLNRNIDAHREAQKAITTVIELTTQHIREQVIFQSNLIRYLQTITLYVDTKDRAVAGQARIINAGLGSLTDDWMKRWESLVAREQRFDARDARMSAHVAALDDLRASVALVQQTALTLKREVARVLESGAAGIAPLSEPVHAGAPGAGATLDAFKYVGFEDAFRGSRDEIRARLATYVPRFEALSDVLDIGCGRGEFLGLLRERGIAARGLDLNHEMVEVCRADGLDVVESDALAYLESLPDASLGGVFAAQVIEHLPPDYLMRLIEACYHKLRPGGLLILETINPACWLAFFESYLRDLTHVRALHPDTLQYLMRVSGFQDVTIEYKSPVAEAARLQAADPPPADAPPVLADLVETLNDNVTKLNARLFTFQDYAAVGRR